ncbi:hypothetical protein KR009_000486, partial [Drosophila setifemur]
QLIILSLGLMACVGVKPSVGAALYPGVSPFGIYPGSASPYSAAFAAAPYAAPFGASLGPSPLAPLAVSSSQRLDYFNQFNAAFAPTAPARLLTGGGPFPFPAAGRLIQPARLIGPGVTAPFFF